MLRASLRRISTGVAIIPECGRFAGQVVAHAEVCSTYSPGVYERPVQIRAVHGLTVLEEGVFEDPSTLRALSLMGHQRRPTK